jgi:hypothetical protein
MKPLYIQDGDEVREFTEAEYAQYKSDQEIVAPPEATNDTPEPQ